MDVTNEKQSKRDVSTDRFFGRNKTNDSKNFLVTKTPSLNRIADEKRNVDPFRTNNNFFLTSNRLNLQSRQERNRVIFSKDDLIGHNEFIFLKKVKNILLIALNSERI